MMKSLIKLNAARDDKKNKSRELNGLGIKT